MYRSILGVLLVSLATACAGVEDTAPAPEVTLCAPGWAERVELSLGTGDGKGHGPDTGSTEWQSVVEFRLGVRDLSGLPARGSDAWCHYVDKLVIEAEPVVFVCDDAAASQLAVHFLRTEPPSMVARRGDSLSLMVQQRSASGARYEGSAGSFWEHGGEAMVMWGENKPEMRCTVSP